MFCFPIWQYSAWLLFGDKCNSFILPQIKLEFIQYAELGNNVEVQMLGSQEYLNIFRCHELPSVSDALLSPCCSAGVNTDKWLLIQQLYLGNINTRLTKKNQSLVVDSKMIMLKWKLGSWHKTANIYHCFFIYKCHWGTKCWINSLKVIASSLQWQSNEMQKQTFMKLFFFFFKWLKKSF